MKFNPVLFIFPALALAACAGPATNQGKLVAANTAFAFGLMHQITQAKPDANIFISPYSVSSALQMTAAGAAGDTRAEMQRVLQTAELPAGSLAAAYLNLDQQFNARPDVTLNIANGLWVQRGFQLKPEFVDTNRKFYRAGLADVDFGNSQAAQAINDWADQQTHGKIKEVVQFPFPPRTRLILADAIYFKGTWVSPFKESATWPRPFHLANGSSEEAPMMAQEGHFVYQESGDFQAVKLPYKGGLQMELYLPPTNGNLPKLVQDLAAKDNWQTGIQSGFSSREGTVILPKFKLDYSVSLNEPLKALGMQKAFGDSADFSGLAAESVSISQVKQKSYVDVDEQGTEAAAVTTVGVTAMAIVRPPANRFTMILDRPFFFVISDRATGSILFMGAVDDPSLGRN